MTSHRILRPGAIALLVLLATALPGAAQFNCFPSCAEDDGRLLAIAGNGLITLSDTVLELELSVPAGTTSFELGIFDGDGGVKVGGQNRWDTGVVAPYEYTLFADPLADGAGTDVVPLDSDFFPLPGYITGSQMLNDDWCCADVPVAGPSTPGNFVIFTGSEAQAPSGNFFYRLRIELTNPAAGSHLNGFKIRTSGIVTIEASEQPISYVANFGDVADLFILYPDLAPDFSNFADPAVRATSTYDGRFSFFFEVDEVDSELTVWDGDFDYGKYTGDRRACELPPNSGSGVFDQDCLADSELDTDDANTANDFIPAFAVGTDAVEEGVALARNNAGIPNPVATGAPTDDLPSAGFDNLRVRSPSIRWDLVAPDAQVFAADDTPDDDRNRNASGNQEWERFTLSTAPFNSALMDFSVTSIPLGTYEMRIEGVDVQNLNAVLLPFRALCVDVFGAACEALKPYLVGDTVFRDDDGDGIQDPVSEPGIGGVIVNLLDAAGNVLDSTATDANGEYSFEVEDGTFRVEIADENFSGATDGAVGDLVWIDDNGDGNPDSTEPGIANVRVRLFDAGGDGDPGGGDDTFLASTLTDGEGRYLFAGLPAGTYFVVVDESTLPDGLSLVPLSPGVLTPTGTIAAGGAYLALDYGYNNADPLTANVGDRVWSDLDGDGVQDPGEPGIGGVTLDLVEDPDGLATVVATTTTDGSGFYLFADVPAAGGGTPYAVVVTDTDGVLAAYDQTGDPDEAGTCTVCDGSQTVTLFQGVHISTVDFGYQNDPNDLMLYSIADRTWFDADHDGIQDPGEVGIDGVTVSLIGFGGKVIATTTTVDGGNFSFIGLPDGDYTIVITDTGNVLGAYLQTTPPAVAGSLNVEIDGDDVSNVSFGYNDDGVLEGTAGTTDVGTKPPGNNAVVINTELQIGDAPIVDGEGNAVNNLDFDFGFQGLASIGDRLWLDRNRDGVQDDPSDEPGINGVTVELLDANGDVFATDVTSGDGKYLFENLLPGDYTVQVETSTLPAGLAQTYDLDGLSTPDRATVILDPGEEQLDVDFGYAECGACMGKVTDLTLQYLGDLADPHIVVVEKKGATVFDTDNLDQELAPDGSFRVVGSTDTLGTEISIYIDGGLHVKIHTSCSQPIAPGLQFAEFLVLAGGSRVGGALCPGPHEIVCGECKSKALWLTLLNDGPAAMISVAQKDGSPVFGPEMVGFGDEFTFYGATSNGTLGTEITVFVGPTVEIPIHTSCSQPLGIGSRFCSEGRCVEVTAGASNSGGGFCPLE